MVQSELGELIAGGGGGDDVEITTRLVKAEAIEVPSRGGAVARCEYCPRSRGEEGRSGVLRSGMWSSGTRGRANKPEGG